MIKIRGRFKLNSVLRSRIRRIARAWPGFFFASLFKFWSDSLGGSGAIVAFFVFAISWRIGNARAHSMQLDALSITIRAFILAGFVWIGIAAVVAALKAYREETKNGGWRGQRRVFAEPICVAVSVFADSDADKVAQIRFDEAEPDSFVQYQIILEPPVEGRASFYLEGHPRAMDALTASIRWGSRGAVAPAPIQLRSDRGGYGLKLNGKYAYLRVKLLPDTVPVTARVYMTSFEIRAD